MRYRHIRLGVRYPGQCFICGLPTGGRPWELASTSLYQSEDGRYAVAHVKCAGGKTKSAVGGGVYYATAPRSIIER